MRKELPCINNVIVLHPFKRVPYDVCTREEIACPYKLLAVCQTPVDQWDDIIINDISFKRTWVQMRKKYPSVSRKISSLGFYCVSKSGDESMFHTILALEDDAEQLYEWLTLYGKTYAAITCPVFCYRNKFHDMIYYVTNAYPPQSFQAIPTIDITEQLLNESAYTMMNGLTLLIALHRLGHFSEQPCLEAMDRWIEDLKKENKSIYSDVTPDIQELIVQHQIPHVCDHPFYYSCMGRDKASMYVMSYLKQQYNIMEPFVQLHLQDGRLVTNAALQMLPHVPIQIMDFVSMLQDDDDDEEDEDENDDHLTETDLGGLMQAMFCQRGMWKRWMATYKYNLSRYCDISSSKDQFIERCLRRTFQYYNKGSNVGIVRTSRICEFWKQVIQVVDKTKTLIPNFLTKYIMLSYIQQELKKRGMDTGVWIPDIPIAFLMLVVKEYGEKWDIFSKTQGVMIMSCNPDFEHIFPNASRGEEVRDGKTYKKYYVKRQLISLMDDMQAGTTLHTFCKLMKQKLQMRVQLLHHAFMKPTISCLSENEGYTIWMIIQDFLQDHRQLLLL